MKPIYLSIGQNLQNSDVLNPIWVTVIDYGLDLILRGNQKRIAIDDDYLFFKGSRHP